MRRLGLILLLVATAPAAPATADPDLAAALRAFRAEVPRDWSYLQTTTGDGRSLEERHDATRPDFARWSLRRKDGREPSPAEIAAYGETRSRRSRGGTAPRLAEQIDAAGARRVDETAGRATFRCRLRPAEAGDHTADFLHATVVVHRPTRTIEAVTLENETPFSPAFGIRITRLRTHLTFSLPVPGRPSLPLAVETMIRGRAFWVKSLDADLRVAFTDYTPFPSAAP